MSPTSARPDVPVDPPLSVLLTVRTKLRLLEFADKVLARFRLLKFLSS